MLDSTTRLGRRVKRRLRIEKIIWLATVDSRNTPPTQTGLVPLGWQTVLIFSERDTVKLRHIGRIPRVALNFNTEPPPQGRVKTYLPEIQGRNKRYRDERGGVHDRIRRPYSGDSESHARVLNKSIR